MKILEEWSLGNRYKIARVDKFAEPQYMELFNKHMLIGHPILPWRSNLSLDQQEKQKQLKELLRDRFTLKLALLESDELVGWSYGWQDSVHDGDFYMASSLVLPDHRKNGLYTALVEKILELTAEHGFSAVRSRHICTNNPVLIAKLKIGFSIHGFEQDETMGTLVRMIFHHNELRKKAADFRAGKYSEQEIFNLLSPSQN